VASREQWAAVVAEVRRAPTPWQSPALARLYALALEDGHAVLAAEYPQLSAGEREEVIHDLFVAKVKDVVKATEPRSFFGVAIKRRSIDAFRRVQTRHAKEPELRARAAWRQDGSGAEDERLETIDGARALDRLPEEDRDLMLAITFGEDREDIARQAGTTRANVDQRVSRLRKRLQGGGT
jgi:RNA polymerase sigma factor (sigma-70 family)